MPLIFEKKKKKKISLLQRIVFRLDKPTQVLLYPQDS